MYDKIHYKKKKKKTYPGKIIAFLTGRKNSMAIQVKVQRYKELSWY